MAQHLRLCGCRSPVHSKTELISPWGRRKQKQQKPQPAKTQKQRPSGRLGGGPAGTFSGRGCSCFGRSLPCLMSVFLQRGKPAKTPQGCLSGCTSHRAALGRWRMLFRHQQRRPAPCPLEVPGGRGRTGFCLESRSRIPRLQEGLSCCGMFAWALWEGTGRQREEHGKGNGV